MLPNTWMKKVVLLLLGGMVTVIEALPAPAAVADNSSCALLLVSVTS